MNKLVATSLESKFHTFDMRTQHPKNGFPSVSEKVKNYNVYRQKVVYIRSPYFWRGANSLDELLLCAAGCIKSITEVERSL